MPDREQELLVARLDERVKGLERDFALLRDQLNQLAAQLKDVIEDTEKRFVKKEIFQPIQKAVLSIITLVVFAVVAALLGLILPKH